MNTFNIGDRTFSYDAREIVLRDMRLQEVPEQIELCDSLEVLEMQNNEIARVRGLPERLREARFDYNVVRSCSFSKGNRISCLTLCANELGSFDAGRLSHLQHLDLSCNYLGAIPRIQAPLRSLVLNDNRLSSIDNLLHHRLLATLYLSSNQIASAFGVPGCVERLFLGHNYLSGPIWLQEGVQTLSLSYNQITALDHLPRSLLFLDAAAPLPLSISNPPPYLRAINVLPGQMQSKRQQQLIEEINSGRWAAENARAAMQQFLVASFP